MNLARWMLFIMVAVAIGLLLLAGCTNQAAPDPTDPTDLTEPPNPSQPQDAQDVNVEVDPELTNTTVFQNVHLITMTDDQLLENQTVVIKDGTITEIGEADTITIPEDAHIIQGEGKYLMPGLVDMHVHWWRYTGEETLYLANGVTSVQIMWGFPEFLRMREAFYDGRFAGPRFFVTGPIMDGPDPIWAASMVLETPEQAREAVIAVHEEGYDAVKIYEMLTLEVYQEIMKTAQEIGIKVVGHTPRQVGIQQALEHGQNSIEHLSGYNLDNLEEEAVLTAENNVWNTPTLAIVNVLKEEEEIEGLEFIPPRTLNLWRNTKKAGVFTYDLEKRQHIVGTIHENGGKLLAGTDANNPYVVPGFSLHNELEYLASAGLTPYEALKTATYNPAEFLGELDKIGTVEVGKEADLLLLSENPLEDIKNTRTVAGTMVRGQWFSMEDLQEELEELRYKY